MDKMDKIKVGVTAVIRDERGRVLLGLKGRACSPDLVGKWVTPGGRLLFRETLIEGIIREVREETNCHIQLSGHLPPQELFVETDKGHQHFVFFVFDAILVNDQAAKAGDDLTDLRLCDETTLLTLWDAMTPLTQKVLLRTR